MTHFHCLILRAKARHQTERMMRKYRVRVWWGLESWTESEMRMAWGDR